MPRVIRTNLLPLVFVLAVVVAACAEPPNPQVDVGSGVRFLPEVADSLNDAGRYSSIVTNADGLPVVAYFAFQEKLEKGEVPVTRPVGLPTIPGVFLATVSEEGYWTRGAIAIAEQIPNVAVAFDPAFEPSVADLTAQNVTGLQLVADDDTYHAVWGSADGVFYATGSLDPATTTQAQVSKVTSTPGVGPSISLVGGRPMIAFYTSTSAAATVQLATQDGDRWSAETIANAPGCDTCRTAVVASAGGPIVAYADGAGIQVATHDVENGWTSVGLGEGVGGEGLSGTATSNGVAFSYYQHNRVTVATGSLSGRMTSAGLDVASGSGAAEGAATSVAVDANGTVSVAWVDASEGVRFATGAIDALKPVDTGTTTVDAAFPSVAVNLDGSTAYLSWYETEEEDLLVGAYGDLGVVPFAAPSPTPTGPISTPPPPTETCTPVQNGTVSVVAKGISFTEGRCIEAAAGEPFTIQFDNQDADTQHNIEIFSGDQPSGDTLFEGEIITGPAKAEYQVPALDAGTYAFNCVVHNTMVGEVRVGGGAAAGGGGEGGGGGGATTATVTASGIAFDTSTIDLAAGQASTIHFVNKDTGTQHNIAIYPSADDLANPLFRGELVTGPDEIDYAIDPLKAGQYYFQCDVHTTMNGTVVVS